MSIYNPRASGLGYAPAYQVSGKPYVTGSVVQGAGGSGAEEVKVTFPQVTKSITVACTGAAGTAIRFHFDSIQDSANVGGQHGPGTHAIPLYATTADVNHVFTFDAKCKEIFISNPTPNQTGFILYAELTSIPSSDMYELTGSGINEA
jgi:hypothetical protein|tara:strand:+ start:257 stop:700 length:444 start_codon:yes stop_codon:yes gene_type:complete